MDNELCIRGFPSSLLVSPEGKTMDLIQGYVDAKSFTQRVAPLLKRSQDTLSFRSGAQGAELQKLKSNKVVRTEISRHSYAE